MAKPKRVVHALPPRAASPSLYHAVSQLREAIIAGRLVPGDRLVELELADQLGLSRGPVREAIQQLAREGLVTVRPNRGAVVSPVNAEDVLEVYALRAMLGTLALRNLLGTNRATPEFLARLESISARAQASRGEQAGLVRADLEFQAAIADSCGLRRVARRFEELTSEISLFINALDIRYQDVGTILAEHTLLIDALRARDLDLAETVWHGRFARAVREFIELIPDGADTLRRLPWMAVDGDAPARRRRRGEPFRAVRSSLVTGARS